MSTPIRFTKDFSEDAVRQALTSGEPATDLVMSEGQLHASESGEAHTAGGGVPSKVVLIGLLLVSYAVFASALQIGLIADDYSFLALSTKDLILMRGYIFRPLGLTVFALSNQIFTDSSPAVLHMIGLSLHAVNAFLLYYFSRAVTKNHVVAIFAAFAWLLCPTAVEPTNWISALVFYLPMTFLVLLTLLLTHREYGKLALGLYAITPDFLLRLGIFFAAMWAIALMFHEIALALPVLVGLMFYGGVFFPSPRLPLRSHFFMWFPTLLVMVVYGILRIALSAPSQLLSYTISERAGLMVYAVWRAFLPTERGIWNLVHLIENLDPAMACLVVGFLLGAPIAVLWRWTSLRPVAWGIVATTVSALPPVVFATTGGRYLYLPSIMAFLTLGLASSATLRSIANRIHFDHFGYKHRQTWARIAMLGLFLTMSAMNLSRTYQENENWTVTSLFVRNLEEQVTRLMPRVLANRNQAIPFRILVVDFPNGTFNAGGVLRVANRTSPQFVGEIDVSGVYLNDRKPYITWGDSAKYVVLNDVMELKSSTTVLIYCEGQKQVYLLGDGPIPCFAYPTSKQP